MYKKFLNAILFGALILGSAGTITSCKDYDDEIDEINQKLNTLTSKDELTAQIATLQSAISSASSSAAAAQTAAENALAQAKEALASAGSATDQAAAAAAQEAITAADAAAAKAAADKAAEVAAKASDNANAAKVAAAAAEKAAAAAKQAALDAVKAEIEKLKEELGSVSDSTSQASSDVMKKVEEALAAAKKEVEAITGGVIGAVTSVSLVDSYTAAQIYGVMMAEQGTYANHYWGHMNGYTMHSQMGDYEFPAQDNPLDLNFTTIFEAGTYTAAQGWNKWMTEYQAKPFNFPAIGSNLANAMDFVKDRQVNLYDYFVVRVSPANATLTPEMISLVNSNGENLDSMVDVLAVEKFEGTLSRPAGTTTVTRAAEETGLWVVYVALKEYDEKAFAAVSEFLTSTRATINQEGKDPKAGQQETKYVNKILYAAQVNNTPKADAGRYVTSSYDLSLSWTEFQPANRLHFSVNGTKVEKLNNRYDDNSISFYPFPNADQKYEERTWLANKVDIKPNIDLNLDGKTAKTQNADATAKVSDVVNTNTAAGYSVGYANNDDRQKEAMLAVSPGEKFTVKLDNYQGWAYDTKEDGKGTVPVPTRSAVKAMYVLLDQPNAVESIPSEWNAWMTYEYTGINEVVEGTSIDITVSGDELIATKGDIIGFRVYAINWDGTLVDPDGRAFYVEVGSAQTANGIDTWVVPQSEEVTKTKPFSFTSPAQDANYFVWEADMIPYVEKVSDNPTTDLKKQMAFYPAFVSYKDNKWSYVQQFNEAVSKDGKRIEGAITGNLKDVTHVWSVPMINDWLAYNDGQTYSGTLTLQNKTAGLTRTLATIKITFKKVLPTAAPEGYSTKTSQVVNGLYTSYLIPDDWTAEAATKGTMPMLHVFNLGTSDKDVTSLAANYEITFADAAYKLDKDGKVVVKDGKPVTQNVTVKGDKDLEVVKDLIDNSTKHATSVVYNYGKISTALYYKNPDGSEGYKDYVINVDKFDTEFHDIYDKTYSWHWMTLAEYQKVSGNAKAKQADLDKLYTTKVKYGAGSGQEGDDPQFTIDLQYILGVSSIDGLYNAPLSAPYKSSLKVYDATLNSVANGKEEYFDIQVDGTTLKFIPAELATGSEFNGATNPKADVPSKLHIKLIDMYSHKTHEAVVDMTVLKR